MAKGTPAFSLDNLKKSGQRVDNVRWWSPFEKGDFIIFRLVSVEPKLEGSDDSGKFKGTTADGDLFQSFSAAIIESALANIPIGNVVLIEFAGKEKHPKDSKKTIKRYEIYDLGTSFPENAPVPDFDAISARIAGAKESGDLPY